MPAPRRDVTRHVTRRHPPRSLSLLALEERLLEAEIPDSVVGREKEGREGLSEDGARLCRHLVGDVVAQFAQSDLPVLCDRVWIAVGFFPAESLEEEISQGAVPPAGILVSQTVDQRQLDFPASDN